MTQEIPLTNIFEKNISTTREIPLTNIFENELFDVWEIDFIGHYQQMIPMWMLIMFIGGLRLWHHQQMIPMW